MKKNIKEMNYAELMNYYNEIIARITELETEDKSLIIGICDDIDGHFDPHIYSDNNRHSEIAHEIYTLNTDAKWIINNSWRIEAKEKRDAKEALNPALKIKREKTALNKKIKHREEIIENLQSEINNLENNFDEMVNNYIKTLQETINNYKNEISKKKSEITNFEKMLANY